MDNWKKTQAKRKLAFLLAFLMLVVAIPRIDLQMSNVLAEELQSEKNVEDVFAKETIERFENAAQNTVSDNNIVVQTKGNGKVTLDDGTEVTDTLVVSAGDSLTFYFTPDNGNQLAELQINENELTPSDCEKVLDGGNYNGNWKYEISNISEDTTIVAGFEEVGTLSANIQDTGVQIFEEKAGERIEVLPDSEDGGYYVTADTVTVKAPDETNLKKLIRFENDSSYSKEVELEVNQVLNLQEFYWCDEEPEEFGSEQKVTLNSQISIIKNSDIPVVSVNPNKDWVAAHSETFEITGTAVDSALKMVVWFSADEALTDSEVKKEIAKADFNQKIILDGNNGFTHTFVLDTSKATEKFYIYAIDKSKVVSEACEVILYKDGSAPEITDAEFTTGINKKPFGNFGNASVKMSINMQDTVSGNDVNNTSGVGKVKIYAAGDESNAYEGTVKPTSPDASEKTVEVTIPIEGTAIFSTLKELRMKAFDDVGNASIEYRLTDFADSENKIASDKVLLEKAEPVVTTSLPVNPNYTNKEGHTEYWYKAIPSVKHSAMDGSSTKNDYSGLAKSWVTLNGTILSACNRNYEDSLIQHNNTEDKIGAVTSGDLLNMKEGENIVTVYYEDNAGNIGSTEQKIYLDTKVPQITKFSIKHKETAMNRILRLLSFGNYINSEVTVTVEVDDVESVSGNDAASSGLNKVTLYLNGAKYKTMSVKEGNKVTFTVPGEKILEGKSKVYLDAEISATVSDKVGNVSERIAMNTASSDILSSNLMIETVNPNINIVPNKKMYVNEEGVIYNNADTAFSIKAWDVDSGLKNVTIEINEEVLVNETYSAELVKEKVYVVNTYQAPKRKKGDYELVVTVTDNAGNVISDSRTVYKDQTEPEIIKVDMEAAGTVEANGTKLTYSERDYGYYFHADTKVTIYAADGKETGGSGVKKIQYYLVDANGKQKKAVTLKADKDEKISFVVPAQFKGQVYARAYDKVTNVPEKYVTPSGLIVETAKQHALEEHIFLEKEAAPYLDNNGGELYAGDVDIKIGIVDTYSGIRTVEWSVTAPYDTGENQQGTIEIDNTGKIKEGGDSEGWKKLETDKNLVTKMEKSIVVSNNSNDIEVMVKMTDRAGNSSEQLIKFSIDKTPPEIEVSFDVMDTEGGYDQIFNKDRTATITVRERNFSPDNITVNITNTDGVIPGISDWEIGENSENPDDSISNAYIIFDADGDYTMEVSGQDRAENQAESVTVDDFTIDKTFPIISVSYDIEEALNGNYFASERTATISIEEHNFADREVKINGTATNNGSVMAFPQASGFGSVGDIHTASINCDTDGLYRFDVEYMDKAGNLAEIYVGEEYYVDLTAPEVEFELEKFANNGKVDLKIRLTDNNYDYNGVDIILEGSKRGKNLEVKGNYSNIPNGQEFTFADFPIAQEYDDFYTVKVVLTDLAGRTNSENEDVETEKEFSVNRFGSTYDLKEVEGIVGKYIKEEVDVKFREINVNSLDHDKIRVMLDVNGTVRELKTDEDYIVEETGGNGDWYQYDYVLNKSLFAGDGRYIITMYSEDEAGNINENVDEAKKAEISFGVDKTAPMVIPIDIESNTQYPVDVKKATVTVNDNLVLNYVEIFVAGKKCEYTVDGENYTFDIPSATTLQDITVSAFDAAGNENRYVIEDVLVTTNLLARWYNNKPLFIGSLVGAALLLCGGVGLFIILRRRKIKISK